MRPLFVLAMVIGVSTPAFADDLQSDVTEASGNWIAVEFNDGPQVQICVAMTVDGRLGFRADANDLEIRTVDRSWSLAPDVTGDITLKVGTVGKAVSAHTFDSTSLAGVVSDEDAVALFGAMDRASTASMTYGSKKTVNVSLAGSSRALNSFRTCASVHGFAKLGGSTSGSASPF